MTSQATLPSTMPITASYPPPLDPVFHPAILFHQRYRELVESSSKRQPLLIGLEREDGLLSTYVTEILDPGGEHSELTYRYAERLVKFLLWSRGGWRLHIGGPVAIGKHIQETYAADGPRAFDVALMSKVYQRPFTVEIKHPEEVPAPREHDTALGGHLDGCRIGFDLGASDHKIAAVKDGEVLYSDEIPWNPRVEKDISYHYDMIQSALKKAASYLPRVDAIGGSSAGIYIDNEVRIASLFRSIAEDRFSEDVTPLFRRIQREWNVPLEVINDGDVTALAGAMSLESDGMLGIAMGSSEAVGFINGKGRITGWLNELAFAPVDFNSLAAKDEWSGDAGVGAMYFSQQAVNKLARAAKIDFPADMDLPERLKQVQEHAEYGHPGALKIFETIGTYLGYTIPYYAEFYDAKDLLILGRVSSGAGGDIVLAKAREVLKAEFPDRAAQVSLHVPDEKSRRVGQAVAAASLPSLSQL